MNDMATTTIPQHPSDQPTGIVETENGPAAWAADHPVVAPIMSYDYGPRVEPEPVSGEITSATYPPPARTPLLDQPVFVGTSPAGVEWWARREGDEAVAKVNLARLWANHKRRVPLTPSQADRLEDMLSVRASTDGFDLGRTFIRARGEDLAGLAAELDPNEAGVAAAEAASASTEAQVRFSFIAGYLSALNLQNKLTRRQMTRASMRRLAQTAATRNGFS